jgi:hypothetical protein
MSRDLRQFISFDVLSSLNVFYGESFEVILHSSNEDQVPLEGGFPRNTLFFYLYNDHFGIGAKGASLDPNGP